MAYTIGYIFDGGTYCGGECITEVLIRRGRLSPAARFYMVEDNLANLADVEALDRHERRDSLTIPQQVDSRSDALMGEACDWCQGEIDPAPDYLTRCAYCGEFSEDTDEDELCPRCVPLSGADARRSGRTY